MKFLIALLVSAVVLTAQPAFADEPLTATLEARKVLVDAQGAERFESAETARPDDVVEYRTAYRNRSQRTLRGVAATLPVPQGFEYIDKSAGKNVLASLDGATYAAVPLTRKVKGADGREEVRAVPVSEYRYLRWNLGDLPAGATSTVTARMRMSNAPATVVAAAR